MIKKIKNIIKNFFFIVKDNINFILNHVNFIKNQKKFVIKYFFWFFIPKIILLFLIFNSIELQSEYDFITNVVMTENSYFYNGDFTLNFYIELNRSLNMPSIYQVYAFCWDIKRTFLIWLFFVQYFYNFRFFFKYNKIIRYWNNKNQIILSKFLEFAKKSLIFDLIIFFFFLTQSYSKFFFNLSKWKIFSFFFGLIFLIFMFNFIIKIYMKISRNKPMNKEFNIFILLLIFLGILLTLFLK